MNIPALKFEPCQVGWFTNIETGQVVPARCNGWTCKTCGPIRAASYRKRLEPIGWTYLLTFTLEGEQWKPSGQGSDAYSAEQIKTFNKKWRMLRQWMRRNMEGGRDFVWVNELGDRGARLHRHCLITVRWFRFARLRAAARSAGFGRVMKFDRLKTARGGCSYVSKYLTAGLSSRWPKGARRIQTSVPRQKQGHWIFEGLPQSQGKPTWWSEDSSRYLCEITNQWIERETYSRRNEQTAFVFGRPRHLRLILTPRENLHHVLVDRALVEGYFSEHGVFS